MVVKAARLVPKPERVQRDCGAAFQSLHGRRGIKCYFSIKLEANQDV